MAILISLVAVTLVVAYYKWHRVKLTEKYGAALDEYNVKAFKEIIEPSPDNRFVYVTKLAAEAESKKGIRAVPMRTERGGSALHLINKNGTFSAKGPYFVSWASGNWRDTGKTHLVKVLRGTKSWAFKPDHYNQTGRILEKGVEIVEFETKRYPPMSLDDFAARQTKAQPGVQADRP